MRKLIVIVWSLFCVSSGAVADDLYKISLHSHRQAEILKTMDIETIMSVRGGYLVLADNDHVNIIESSGLDTELLASGIERNQLGLDGRIDSKNAGRFRVLYQNGRIRLLLTPASHLTDFIEEPEVFPLPKTHVKITYQPSSPSKLLDVNEVLTDDLTDLLDQVQQTNLESYIYRLQAFTHRLTGTDSNYAARDWLVSKFTEFGYDSVSIDPFIGSQLPDRVPCQSYNVIAYKPGTVYPEKQIVIGAHFDAVPDCPGADDNGSGTALVVEIARVLSNIETRMSLVFIAFDSEESGTKGSIHYVDGVVARSDDIVLMVNADMIAHWENDASAVVSYGPQVGYAELWYQLAGQYAGIVGELGEGGGPDSYAFQQAGYAAIDLWEKVFSTEYHQPSDSANYLNFDYLTRMVKATLGTVYSVCQHPPPLSMVSLVEPGDGHTQIVNWDDYSGMPVDFLRLWYYPTATPELVSSVDMPITETSYTVNGLTEGGEYAFVIQAYDFDGRTSYAYDPAYATPGSLPAIPPGIRVLPLTEGVQCTWNNAYSELDFSHWAIIRDGEVIASTSDTTFTDDDPALGYDLHSYYVVSVDSDANHSDTSVTEPFLSKAAALTAGRILAVNRSSISPLIPLNFVDETLTGTFMREALDGYDFNYYSDTAATVCGSECGEELDLYDMVDYELLVIGDETGRSDNIASGPESNGILDTLAYYLSIGGKTVIFGRWGEYFSRDTIDYLTNDLPYDDAYHDYFHIDRRVLTMTGANSNVSKVFSDLVGAHSVGGGYPYLGWDSLATVAHISADDEPYENAAGIPYASFADLNPEPEVIYTYDSDDDDPLSEGKPVAWRYIGPDYAYVWFEIPLSHIERSSAIMALRQAVDELTGGSTNAEEAVDDEVPPGEFILSQNYPNPFNPFTEICYSLPRASKVNLSIFNILGQKVTTLVDADQIAGPHAVKWDGTDDGGQSLATGIYLYRLTAGELIASKKMLLLK